MLHPEYGLGRIVAIEGEGSGRKGRVAFAVGPVRTFVLAKAPLRPVARPARGNATRPVTTVNLIPEAASHGEAVDGAVGLELQQWIACGATGEQQHATPWCQH